MDDNGSEKNIAKLTDVIDVLEKLRGVRWKDMYLVYGAVVLYGVVASTQLLPYAGAVFVNFMILILIDKKERRRTDVIIVALRRIEAEMGESTSSE